MASADISPELRQWARLNLCTKNDSGQRIPAPLFVPWTGEIKKGGTGSSEGRSQYELVVHSCTQESNLYVDMDDTFGGSELRDSRVVVLAPSATNPSKCFVVIFAQFVHQSAIRVIVFQAEYNWSTRKFINTTVPEGGFIQCVYNEDIVVPGHVALKSIGVVDNPQVDTAPNLIVFPVVQETFSRYGCVLCSVQLTTGARIRTIHMSPVDAIRPGAVPRMDFEVVVASMKNMGCSLLIANTDLGPCIFMIDSRTGVFHDVPLFLYKGLVDLRDSLAAGPTRGGAGGAGGSDGVRPVVHAVYLDQMATFILFVGGDKCRVVALHAPEVGIRHETASRSIDLYGDAKLPPAAEIVAASWFKAEGLDLVVLVATSCNTRHQVSMSPFPDPESESESDQAKPPPPPPPASFGEARIKAMYPAYDTIWEDYASHHMPNDAFGKHWMFDMLLKFLPTPTDSIRTITINNTWMASAMRLDLRDTQRLARQLHEIAKHNPEVARDAVIFLDNPHVVLTPARVLAIEDAKDRPSEWESFRADITWKFAIVRGIIEARMVQMGSTDPPPIGERLWMSEVCFDVTPANKAAHSIINKVAKMRLGEDSNPALRFDDPHLYAIVFVMMAAHFVYDVKSRKLPDDNKAAVVATLCKVGAGLVEGNVNSEALNAWMKTMFVDKIKLPDDSFRFERSSLREDPTVEAIPNIFSPAWGEFPTATFDFVVRGDDLELLSADALGDFARMHSVG